MPVSEPLPSEISSVPRRESPIGPDRADMSGLYEADFYAWALEQGRLLREGCWEGLDLGNLIEEIEALARQQRQELRNRLAVLLGHLLKWEFQGSQRSNSWRATIRLQRREITTLLKESPSLKPYLAEALGLAYPNGRDLAIMETNLPELTFPMDCLYGWDVLLDEDFWPGEAEA
jgi:hypothetical protein